MSAVKVDAELFYLELIMPFNGCGPQLEVMPPHAIKTSSSSSSSSCYPLSHSINAIKT
jgi:hypothetical protein